MVAFSRSLTAALAVTIASTGLAMAGAHRGPRPMMLRHVRHIDRLFVHRPNQVLTEGIDVNVFPNVRTSRRFRHGRLVIAGDYAFDPGLYGPPPPDTADAPPAEGALPIVTPQVILAPPDAYDPEKAWAVAHPGPRIIVVGSQPRIKPGRLPVVTYGVPPG